MNYRKLSIYFSRLGDVSTYFSCIEIIAIKINNYIEYK